MLVTQHRMKGFTKVMATAPQYKVVDEQDANWDPQLSGDIAQQLLAKYGSQRRAGRLRHGGLHGAADHSGGQAGRLPDRRQERADRHQQQLLQGRHRRHQDRRLYGTATEDPPTIAKQSAAYVRGT